MLISSDPRLCYFEQVYSKLECIFQLTYRCDKSVNLIPGSHINLYRTATSNKNNVNIVAADLNSPVLMAKAPSCNIKMASNQATTTQASSLCLHSHSSNSSQTEIRAARS
jgi:hypothetical protein